MKVAAQNCQRSGGADDRQLEIGTKEGRDDCGCEQASNPASQFALQSGDYYFDQGLMVLSRAYHLRRGFCCGNGCRHCPYPVPK